MSLSCSLVKSFFKTFAHYMLLFFINTLIFNVFF